MGSEAPQQSFIPSTVSCTSTLPWIWVIETLASSKEIDTSLLTNLVKRFPVSDDLGRNARELVSYRILESFVHKISNASNVDSVPCNKIEFDTSERCEDVLRRLILAVSTSDLKKPGPETLKWDVQSFITKKGSCLPKCALKQIKDAILDSSNPLFASLKAKSGLVVGNHSRNGDLIHAVDSNGMKQSNGVSGVDAQQVVPNGSLAPLSEDNANGLQENQPRTMVPSKRRADASTAHEGEHDITEAISENSCDPGTKASKKIKRIVISPERNVVHDLVSSQRDGVTIELSGVIPESSVQKGNLKNKALVGGLNGSSACAASEGIKQSSDSSGHDLLTEIMSPVEKIRNVGSSSKACAELRTSSGSLQHVTQQDSRIHGSEGHLECNRGDLPNGELCKGTKTNIGKSHEPEYSPQHATHQDSHIHGNEDHLECNQQDLLDEGTKENVRQSHEPEFSSDSDGYSNEKAGLAAKKNDFYNSQCTQVQDSLETDDDKELKFCVKCNEGGQLLVCSSITCPLVVHESCLGSIPEYDNRGNFYCPFCAYSRAISEYLEGKKRSSLARKDLAAFIGFGAGEKPKKSSSRSHKSKQNQSREDKELCNNENNKKSLNEVATASCAPVNRNSANGEVMAVLSPQGDASIPHGHLTIGQQSDESLPRSRRSKQKQSREEEELCHYEKSNKNPLNQVKPAGNTPLNRIPLDAGVTQMGSYQAEASVTRKLVCQQSSLVEESSEEDDNASRYFVRFRNADKQYSFPTFPQVRRRTFPRTKVMEEKAKVKGKKRKSFHEMHLRPR